MHFRVQSVPVVPSSAPSTSLAGTPFSAFQEHAHSCDLSSRPQRALSNVTKELPPPYSVSEYSPTPCLIIILQTVASILHFATEVARTQQHPFNIGYYTVSMHNLFKINVCAKSSCSATGAALLCCEVFLLLVVSSFYHDLFCFCLGGSCLCPFSVLHYFKAIWINASSRLIPTFGSNNSSFIAGLEIQFFLVSCASGYQNAGMKTDKAK